MIKLKNIINIVKLDNILKKQKAQKKPVFIWNETARTKLEHSNRNLG
jgi:hypothetical protein